jgi:hypothetical protein
MIEVDFDSNTGFGSKVNPVIKPPIRQRNYKKPTSQLSETKTETTPMTKRPLVHSKNPKQARGDSAKKDSNVVTKETGVVNKNTDAATKDMDTANKETDKAGDGGAAHKEMDIVLEDMAIDLKKQYGTTNIMAELEELTAPLEQEAPLPKREALPSKPAEAVSVAEKEEASKQAPEHHGGNLLNHKQTDVKALKPKAIVKELPPLPPSYSQPIPQPAYSYPIPSSHNQAFDSAYSKPFLAPFNQPLGSFFEQPFPSPASSSLPKPHSPTLAYSLGHPSPPSYAELYKPAALEGMFVEPSSLSSAPYLYINKAGQPNVPKIPQSAPYPFVKPAVPPPLPYKSKLEDYTIRENHLSQKRHTPPAPENDINRMDAAATADRLTGSSSSNLNRQDGAEVPRPQGTPKPHGTEDNESEADTNTFSR